MKEILKKQQQDFTNTAFPDAGIRINRLSRLHTMMAENHEQLAQACSQDFGNRSLHQSHMEVSSITAGCDDAIKHLKKWMKPEKRKVMTPLNLMGASAKVQYQPKGVVGNLGTWNFPIYTAILPLVGILAAGNRAMVKLSEFTPKTSDLLKQLIERYFDSLEIAAVTGDAKVGAEFAALPFDHLIFTGGTNIGKHILHAAADNLTPVTLELGGKSPVIVGQSYDTTKAAQRVMTGKAFNIGQACLAPDYCFVPEAEVDTFVKAAAEHFSMMFPSIINNSDYTSVINQRHYERITSMIDDAEDKGATLHVINPKNEDLTQQPEGMHKIPMTLIINPSDDTRIMQEEIFGAALCIKPYKNIDECIRYINNRPRPLGLYYFGMDKNEEQLVLQRTISGGVTLNDVMTHSSCEDLPFGGIGDSGMGHYHGFDGFKSFSHPRAIFKQSKLDIMKLAGMLPPYGDKCKKQLDKMTKIKQ